MALPLPQPQTAAAAAAAAAKKATLKAAATKRLMRDYREIMSDPILGIACEPLEKDLFTWHGNICPLSGPYAGSYFHIILHFPENYPLSPPRVFLCTTIKHPNVFGSVGDMYPYICLDLLKEESSTTPCMCCFS
jgi:ubiquitin-protein ligase